MRGEGKGGDVGPLQPPRGATRGPGSPPRGLQAMQETQGYKVGNGFYFPCLFAFLCIIKCMYYPLYGCLFGA